MKPATTLASLVALFAIQPRVLAFISVPTRGISSCSPPSHVFPLHESNNKEANTISSDSSSNNSNGVVSIDVSDLGITMSDLDKKIPIHNFSFESSGYQSTSRIPDVNDDGCYWVENPEDIDVTLRIPGLRGQPAEALSVLFSTTTVSVAAFGRIVWSAIQMGISDIDDCMFLTEDGSDGVPVIQLSVKKRDVDERWGGFILQVGEDSIL